MTKEKRNKLISLNLEEKISISKNIIKEAINKFGRDKIAIAWTGGKDSTTMVWLYREVCNELSIQLPRCIFIDEGDVFDEVIEHIEQTRRKWDIDLTILRNEDILKKIKKIRDIIKIKELNDRNKKELKLIGFEGDEFLFEPESYVGNHLMKTVPLKIFIEENGIEAISTAIRWDEQEAREDEEFFSPREKPKHTRIHPILHFRERDIWHTILKYKIPYCRLYEQGYRSLGSRYNTQKLSDLPAWEQDLESTPERAGRGQEKEKIMDQLRQLGYM